MEPSLSTEDAAFRDEVRSFIAENYPAEMCAANPETDLTKEQSLLWHRILYRKGWIAPLWPKEYGGPGWPITHRYLRAGDLARRYASAASLRDHHGGAGHLHVRQSSAKEQISAAHSVRRRLVVPGLFRAGRRLRSRVAPHQGDTLRRPLRGQWAQDLDHAGAACCAPDFSRLAS
jgi:alkylation response protein AidB-like acyl-CoA dehydrogenase